MRKPILAALPFLLLLGSLSTQGQPSGDELAVQQVMTKVFDGLSALDMQLVRQCTTNDMVILEIGTVWNLDSLANRIAPLKSMSFTRINHLDFKRTEVRGNTAWVYYDNVADMSIGGKAIRKHWLESAVLIKEGKDWKIRMLHSTLIN